MPKALTINGVKLSSTTIGLTLGLSDGLKLLFTALENKKLFKNPNVEAIQFDSNGVIYCKYSDNETFNSSDITIKNPVGRSSIPALEALFKEMGTLRISKRCFLESKNALRPLLMRYKDLLSKQGQDGFRKNYSLLHKKQTVKVTPMSSCKKGHLAFHLPDEASIFNEHILGLSSQREVEDIAL